MIFEILSFIIGLVFGYVKPLKEGQLLYGIIIVLFISGIFALLVQPAAGFVLFSSVVICVIIFAIGTFIGDVLKKRSKRR